MKRGIKKNIIAIIVSLIVLIFPFVFDYLEKNDYRTPSNQMMTTSNIVDVNINEDGSMKIKESISLKTSYKEIYKDIIYSSGRVLDESGYPVNEMVNTPSFSKKSSDNHIKVIKSDGEILFDSDATSNIGNKTSSTSLQFSFIPGAVPHDWNDGGSYNSVVCESFTRQCESIYIYDSDGLGPKVTIEYTYTILGAVNVYSDIAELNWKLATTNYMKTNNVAVNVTLPSSLNAAVSYDDIKVFGHNASLGKVIRDENNPFQFTLKASKLYPDEEIEARILFPKTLLNIEQMKVDENKYNNFHDFSQLPRVLTFEKHTEQSDRSYFIKNILSLVIGVILVIVSIVCLYLIYLKYDREYKSTFDDEYYRELPADYGPAIMSYLYKFGDIDKNSVNATLMDLVRKKVIKIDYAGESLVDKKPNYRLIRQKIDGVELNEYEKKLLEWFFDVVAQGDELLLDQLANFNSKEQNAIKYQTCNKEFNNSIKKEGEKRHFFENPKIARSRGYLLGMVLGFVGIFYIYLKISLNLSYPLYLAFIMFALAVISLSYTYSIIKRSKQGNEDYVRWKAFAHFLEDFSNIKDYPMPGIEVWDKYMVYATAFGIAELVEKQLRFRYKELHREEEISQSSYLQYPMFYHYTSYRMTNAMMVANTTIMRSKANRVNGSSHRGGGGFGGGSSFGGGGGGMRGR